MVKSIQLFIKFAPILWAFIKEVLLKREDKRYFIRNKFQIFVTVLVMIYSLILFIVYEGYNAHANSSMKKSQEIDHLVKVITRKTAMIDELTLKNCPVDQNEQVIQDMLDQRIIDRIVAENAHVIDQK